MHIFPFKGGTYEESELQVTQAPATNLIDRDGTIRIQGAVHLLHSVSIMETPAKLSAGFSITSTLMQITWTLHTTCSE